MATENDLIDKILKLRATQQQKISKLVDAFQQGTDTWIDDKSDIVTNDFAQAFADNLIFDHLSSVQPLTKDKFEYAMVSSFLECGRSASKTISNTYPGQDIIVDGQKWSLKTEAAKNMRRDEIHISKFMELGQGKWEDEEDIQRMRQRMFFHMTHYQRIFTLRCFKAASNNVRNYEYELVEIPKSLLQKADNQKIEFKKTRQLTAQPASCNVFSDNGSRLFELYFDGGSERKLQVRHLLKSACILHATWNLTVRP